MKNWNYIEGAKVGNYTPNYRYKGFLITNPEGYEFVVFLQDGLHVGYRGTTSKAQAEDWCDWHDPKTGKPVAKFRNSKTGNELPWGKGINIPRTKEKYTFPEPNEIEKKIQEAIKRGESPAFIEGMKDVLKKAKEERNKRTGNDTPWEYAHRKPKVINDDKTGAEEFFKQLSDDVKEREKKDDADIEKVGNASVSGGTFKSDDGSQKAVIDVNPQSGTARVVWFENDRQNASSDYRSIDLATAAVKRKGLKKVGNFKTGTSQLKPGDKVMSFGKKGTVKEVIGENTDNIYGEPLIKVEFEDGTTKTIGEHYMRKVGNARYTTREDVISHLDTDLYDICKKVPAGSPSFAYVSELQKKGWDISTISKYTKEIGKIIDQYKAGNKVGNSTWEEPRRMPFQPRALRYAYEQAKKKGLSGQKLEAEMLRIAKTTPHDSAATEDQMRKDVSEWVLHNGKPEDFVNNKQIGNSAYDDGAKKGKEDKRKGKLITAAGFEYHAPGYSSLSFKEKEEYKKGYYSTNDLKKEDIYKWGNSAPDDKFAYVMREFDEGKLKTPDGKVVTDPAQAKAIAYSESKKTENGLARARKAMNKGITMWKGNDSAYIKEDGTVSYLENNSFETDKDKFESQESAIKELSKQGYVKK